MLQGKHHLVRDHSPRFSFVAGTSGCLIAVFPCEARNNDKDQGAATSIRTTHLSAAGLGPFCQNDMRSCNGMTKKLRQVLPPLAKSASIWPYHNQAERYRLSVSQLIAMSLSIR